MTEKRPPRRGSALVVVLWVIGLLAMLISSLAFDAHIESKITSYYRKRMKADHLMQSGMAIAELLMGKSVQIRPHSEPSAEDEEDRWHTDARRLKEGDSVTVTEALGEGTIEVTIVSERARRNVNLLTLEDEWEGILEVGDVPEEAWPELIESFLDWTDKDDNARLDGAESEYYESLDPPYRPKNGPLDTVDELLLVKGFTRTILYGGVIDPESSRSDPITISGIADLLSAPFGDKKINVNSASRRVLMTLPDRTGDLDLIVDAIFLEMEGDVDLDGVQEPAFFESDQDLMRRIPELARPNLKDYVTTSASSYFRVTSVGKVGNVERKSWAIVKYDRGKLTTLQWREEG